eukprot:GEMP01000841.1.p1 GENE.GEMP01000841.1~~GEMP01000841.1.p1  ORF type:complete len:1208 (+),score=228.10 GEMP01000841.1:131-3754(+)
MALADPTSTDDASPSGDGAWTPSSAIARHRAKPANRNDMTKLLPDDVDLCPISSSGESSPKRASSIASILRLISDSTVRSAKGDALKPKDDARRARADFRNHSCTSYQNIVVPSDADSGIKDPWKNVMTSLRAQAATAVSSKSPAIHHASDEAQHLPRLDEDVGFTSLDGVTPLVKMATSESAMQHQDGRSTSRESFGSVMVKDASREVWETARAFGYIACEEAKPAADAPVSADGDKEDKIFVFSFCYQEFHWHVRRSMSVILHLSRSMLKLVAVNIANHDRWKKITDFYHEVKQFQQVKTKDDRSVSDFLERLRTLLNWFLKDRRLSRNKKMLEFIEVSWLSFGINRSQKYREGYIFKSRGGRKYTKGACFNGFTCLYDKCARSVYQKRWFLILDDAVCYADKNDPKMKLRSVLWFDSNTKVMAGAEETGRVGGLVVKNQYRTLRMEVAGGEEDAQRWKEAIRDAASNSSANTRYRFNSFAEEQEGVDVRLLVDGQAYFDALYDALEHAKTSIYISDWWMTPTILLRRCGSGEDALIAILKRKAEEGVLVRVTLYKEMDSVMYNSSKYVDKMLSAAHKNIQVQRHPDHSLVSLGGNRGVLFWSHHEKLVCIDAEVCFVGGLDLCLGRYDNFKHTLMDNDPCRMVFPGKDYSNPVIKDFYDVTNYNEDMLSRHQQPRMPWHDVHCMLKSKAFARDLAKHFMQLWNHILTDKNKIKRPAHNYLTLPPKENATFVLPTTVQKSQNMRDVIRKHLRKFGSSVVGTDQRAPSQLDVAQQSSMPTRDSDIEPESSSTPVGNVAASDPTASYTAQATDRPRTLFSISERGGFASVVKRLIQSSKEDVRDKPKHEVVHPADKCPTFHDCRVQFCRSSSPWSNGLETDSSIHSAYVTLIQNARNFIYIENQFFITSTHRGENSLLIKNRIGEAIVSKIEEKHAKGEPFKLYVIMPIMPAFEADAFALEAAWQCRQTMFAQYLSIIDGPDSIIGALQDSLPNETDWENYVVFCSLRQIDTTPDGVLHGTQIYIHSKCAVIDDEHVIIGSANINDRSMLGSRDSEIVVVISNHVFAKSTRMRLWCEHFNVLDDTCGASKQFAHHLTHDVLADPLSDVCWKWWIQSASALERILYEKMHSWPNSMIHSWPEYQAAVDARVAQVAKFTSAEWDELSKQIRGVTHGSRVVMFPLLFLNKEDIRFPRPAQARLASNRIFT